MLAKRCCADLDLHDEESRRMHGAAVLHTRAPPDDRGTPQQQKPDYTKWASQPAKLPSTIVTSSMKSLCLTEATRSKGLSLPLARIPSSAPALDVGLQALETCHRHDGLLLAFCPLVPFEHVAIQVRPATLSPVRSHEIDKDIPDVASSADVGWPM